MLKLTKYKIHRIIPLIMQIYLARNNVQAGPYSLAQLNNMLAAKEVHFDDLIWHVGMDEWQRVGDVTNNQYNYQPPQVGIMDTSTQPTDQRATVEQLFGNQPISTQEKSKKEVEQHHVAHVSTTKTTVSKKQTTKKTASTYELANPIIRIFAALIDNIIITATFAPIIFSIGIEKFSSITRANKDTYSQVLELSNLIPNHIMYMVLFFMLAIFFIQITLLIRRGQTLGKLITGIRILDKKSKQLPTATNIVLLRTIITNIAYSLPFGIILIAIDVLAMFTNKDKQSIHDKLAKTIVVTANDEQIDAKTHKK